MSETTAITEPPKNDPNSSRTEGLKPGTECKLLRLAISKRWNIPDDLRKDLPQRMAFIVESAEADRDKIAAAKVIVTMEGQNQEDQQIEDKNSRLDAGKPTEAVQFKAFLGIDPDKV